MLAALTATSLAHAAPADATELKAANAKAPELKATALKASCKTIEQCIAQIPAVKGEILGAGEVNPKLKAQLQSFGRQALVPLVALTADKNANRRRVADTLISEIKDFTPADFALIKQMLDNNITFEEDSGTAYQALGMIGGKQAAQVLVAELLRIEFQHYQITNALTNIGVDAL